jgi:FkbM family methyltransferase
MAGAHGLKRRLPAPLRSGAAQALASLRRRAFAERRRLAARRPLAIPLEALLHLIYPQPLPADLGLEDQALAAAGGRSVGDLATLRRVLSALDGPSAPSPVLVRFGPEDLLQVRVSGVTLALDAADVSVSQAIAAAGEYEPAIAAFMAGYLEPGMTVVDCGANVGYHSLLAARLVGPHGRVVAVEPYSENCRLLLISVALNGVDNVTVVPVALDERRGWAHLSPHLGSNASFIADGADALAQGYGTVVPTFPLDDLVAGPVHLLKVDIEGAEMRAMRGATALIATHRPVVISEVSDEMLRRVSGCSVGDYLGWFAERGYRISVLEPSGARPVDVADLESFLASWTDPFRIENLLLRPR